MANIFTFGRGANQIVRFPTSTVGDLNQTPDGQAWPRYGQPRALLPLNTLRIVDTEIDPDTGEFLGFYYNYGTGNRSRVLIPSIDLIPGWNDDANLYDNTPYSGLSLVWTILSISQSNQVCNDEDVPESFKAVWAKWGHFYAGSKNKKTIKRFSQQFEAASMVVHGNKEAKAEVFDMARSLLELTQAREANAKYMLWCIGLPLFVMFEDTANFATANQALQAFKAISIKRYRTWLSNMLERYWYDPMLADHLNVDVADVVAEEVKVSAVFEDIIFDTFKDKVDALVPLAQANIIDKLKVLKELGYDDVIERLEEIEAQQNKLKQDSINATVEKMIANGTAPPNIMAMVQNRQRQKVNPNAAPQAPANK
jgi:hypothetical protein